MRKFARLLTVAAFCVGAFAQQTTPPAIQTFMQETVLPFTNIGITGEPNVPANVLQALAAGALQVRQQVELLSGDRLRIRHILVQPGAPIPTPAGAQVAMVEDYVVRINDTVRGANPASATWVGVVDRFNTDSPFVGRTGVPVVYSIGWEGTPRRFGNAALLVPGRMATWAMTSTGTLVLDGDPTPGTPPPTGNRPPNVVIVGAPRFVTVQPGLILDASGSTDPDGGALRFSWRVVRGSATLLDPGSATPRVQFSNSNEYIFEVTVTDSAGAQSTGTVEVFYAAQF